MSSTAKTAFVPQLAIAHGTMSVEFYKEAFGAVETIHLTNDDGSIHVSEMFIDGAMFHIHEESWGGATFAPGKHNGITTTIGLMVPDADAVMARAVGAGAVVIQPLKTYDYGYRQGTIQDPHGHHWIIEQIVEVPGMEKYRL